MDTSVRARSEMAAPPRPHRSDERSIPCEACGEWVPISGYELTPRGYPRRVCRTCRAERKRQRYETDAEYRARRLERSRAYVEENRTYTRERNRQRYAENRERLQAKAREYRRRRKQSAGKFEIEHNATL